MKRQALCCLLLASCLLFITDARKLKSSENSNNSWDFLLLVRQWPGSFCSEHACPLFKHRDWERFTIHGLWPNRNDGTWPEFCRPDMPFDAEEVDDLLDDLDNVWPSYMDSQDSEAFWAHEWNKHGTCALAQLPSQHKFFKKVIKLNYRYKLEVALYKARIVPDATHTYSKTEVQQAIRDLYGVDVQVHCTPNGHLSEVWMCFDKDLEPMDCKPPSHNDNQCTRVLIPPIPGSHGKHHDKHDKHEKKSHKKGHSKKHDLDDTHEDDDHDKKHHKHDQKKDKEAKHDKDEAEHYHESHNDLLVAPATTTTASSTPEATNAQPTTTATLTTSESTTTATTNQADANSVAVTEQPSVEGEAAVGDVLVVAGAQQSDTGADGQGEGEGEWVVVDGQEATEEETDEEGNDNEEERYEYWDEKQESLQAEDAATTTNAAVAAASADRRARPRVHSSALVRTVCIASAGSLVGVIVIMTVIASWTRRLSQLQQCGGEVAIAGVPAQLVIPAAAAARDTCEPSPRESSDGTLMDPEASLKQPLLRH